MSALERRLSLMESTFFVILLVFENNICQTQFGGSTSLRNESLTTVWYTQLRSNPDMTQPVTLELSTTRSPWVKVAAAAAI